MCTYLWERQYSLEKCICGLQEKWTVQNNCWRIRFTKKNQKKNVIQIDFTTCFKSILCTKTLIERVHRIVTTLFVSVYPICIRAMCRHWIVWWSWNHWKINQDIYWWWRWQWIATGFITNTPTKYYRDARTLSTAPFTQMTNACEWLNMPTEKLFASLVAPPWCRYVCGIEIAAKYSVCFELNWLKLND